MQRPVRLPTIARNIGLGALCLAGVATCGDNTVYVRVNVSGIPAQTATVSLRPFVDALAYGQELFNVGASDRTLIVGFKLPADTRGAFRVEVEPRGSDGMPIKSCDVSWSGTATAEIIDKQSTSVDVTLDAKLPASGLNKDLYAVWGSASDDVWVAGAGGLIGHWNGCYWRNVPSKTQSALRGIHGFVGATKEIWVVGGDSPSGMATVARSTNGVDFTAMSLPITGQLNDVWGTGGNRLWAVGGNSTDGIILKNTSGQLAAWVADTGLSGTGITTTFLAIEGHDENKIFAVGQGTDMTCTGGCRGSIAVYNGATWQRPTFPDAIVLNLSQVYVEPPAGGDPATAWLSGIGGLMADTDGTIGGSNDLTLSLNAGAMSTSLCQGLIGFAPANEQLYFTLSKPDEAGVLRRYTMGNPSTTPVMTTGDPITEQTFSLWGKSDSDFWIVGKNGARYHYEGGVLKKYVDPM